MSALDNSCSSFAKSTKLKEDGYILNGIGREGNSCKVVYTRTRDTSGLHDEEKGILVNMPSDTTTATAEKLPQSSSNNNLSFSCSPQQPTPVHLASGELRGTSC